MKKLNLGLIENILLSVLAISVFLGLEFVIPKYLISVGIIGLSFYFFPIKLLTNKIKEFSKLYFASDFIISVSLILLIVGFYIEHKIVITVFSILNFAYLVFFTFQFSSKEKNNNLTRRRIIINHLIVILLLSMSKYF